MRPRFSVSSPPVACTLIVRIHRAPVAAAGQGVVCSWGHSERMLWPSEESSAAAAMCALLVRAAHQTKHHHSRQQPMWEGIADFRGFPGEEYSGGALPLSPRGFLLLVHLRGLE